MPVRSLDFGDLRIEGSSRAADSTWFRIHPPGLAFDAGRGALQLTGASDVFLSHGHLDHALGVPFLLSQRGRHRGLPTRVFCPREMASALADFVAAAGRLEGGELPAEITGIEAGDRIEVGRDLHVEAFDTDHVVPSLGYHLVESRRSLRPDLIGLEGEELVRRRDGGEEIEVIEPIVRVSYCGDTTAAVLDRLPQLYQSEILMLECTFLADAAREKGARYGHVHWLDIEERADRFQNRAIVLHHISRRHSSDELEERVRARAPQLAGRIHVF